MLQHVSSAFTRIRSGLREAQPCLDSEQKERDNSIESAMIPSLTAFLERRSNVGLTLACILALSATPANAIKMAKIAQFSYDFGWHSNFPCGNVRDGKCAIFGNSAYPTDSMVAYEYEGDNQFQRVNTGVIPVWGPWAFGDGDNDGKMEVAAMGGGAMYATVVIWEAQSQNSFPSESVWSACPRLGGGQYCYMKYVDFWRDGHQEVAVAAGDSGIKLYKNSGDNSYFQAAALTDTPPPWFTVGDFAVADLDRDSLMDLVTGNGSSSNLRVFEAIGNDSWTLAAICTTATDDNTDIASAHDMDLDGWPEFVVIGINGADAMVVSVCEATGRHHYRPVWQQACPDFNQGDYGNPISVADVDGDQVEEFGVSTGGGVALFKCSGPHEYSEVWHRESTGTYLRLFDINSDSRAEVIFDGPQGTEIWEDTEGLGVAEFSKLPQPRLVSVQPTVARLGVPVVFSGVPPGSDIEVLSLDGRLVSRTRGVRQLTWTWNLRNRSGNLVPAGTYFAVIRSKGKSTSLKLCLVK